MSRPETACAECGGLVVASLQTVPYIAPGPRLLELRDVHERRCMVCGHLEIDVPERRVLDRLARSSVEIGGARPQQVAYEGGRWRLVR